VIRARPQLEHSFHQFPTLGPQLPPNPTDSFAFYGGREAIVEEFAEFAAGEGAIQLAMFGEGN
jgi:hypothetical protein